MSVKLICDNAHCKKRYINIILLNRTGRWPNWGVNEKIQTNWFFINWNAYMLNNAILLLLIQFNHSFPLGNTGQCVFQGIAMFDKTVWSPKPCVTCLCSSGNVVCDEMQCPVLRCHFKFKPIGQCCPICIEPSEWNVLVQLQTQAL